MELIPLGATLAREGMIQGTGGNLSYREGERILITARGARLGEMQATDLVALSLKGEPLATGAAPGIPEGPAPSSEWAIHVAAYHARPESLVVIHAHPPKAIALGLLSRPLPALTPDQYLHLGSRVPLVRYLTPGTPALAAAIADGLRVAPAALLQNHGVVVTAATPKQAHLRLTLLEEACGIYLAALAVGAPQVLSEEHMRALDEATGGRYRLQ